MESKSFNASLEVTDLLTKTLENMSKEFAMKCIIECGKKYNFDADSAIREMGLENVTLLKKVTAKKQVVVQETSKPEETEEKVEKVEKAVIPKKSSFPMPFMTTNISTGGCQGLVYNHGLFTQCTKKRVDAIDYCKCCQQEGEKNGTDCPDCGTVTNRLTTGLYEFKDPKGRSPLPYLKVLLKLTLTSDQALEEAAKLNLTIPECHFEVVEKAKKPSSKKEKVAVQAENVDDLFKQLTECTVVIDEETPDTQEAPLDVEIDEETTESVEVVVVVKDAKKIAPKTVTLTKEEKDVKKAELESKKVDEALKKQALKAEEELKKQALKEEAELKKQALKEEAELKKQALKAEAELKKQALKAEAELKKETDKIERENKRVAEIAEKKQQLDNKKIKALPVTAPVITPVITPVATPVITQVTAPVVENQSVIQHETVSVQRVTINGILYLKSSTNILYNPKTKEEMAIWDPKNNRIKDLPEDGEEEEEVEESYEEED